MNSTQEKQTYEAMPHHVGMSVGEADVTQKSPTATPTSTKRMMIAGGLGLLAAALVVAAPEIGIGGVIGGAIAGSGSAIATLFAKR
jgi:hypothetical protein